MCFFFYVVNKQFQWINGIIFIFILQEYSYYLVSGSILGIPKSFRAYKNIPHPQSVSRTQEILFLVKSIRGPGIFTGSFSFSEISLTTMKTAHNFSFFFYHIQNKGNTTYPIPACLMEDSKQMN